LVDECIIHARTHFLSLSLSQHPLSLSLSHTHTTRWMYCKKRPSMLQCVAVCCSV